MFQIGDKVIHWTYGPGEIIQVEEKSVASETMQYYKVQVRDLTIWVPYGEAEQHRLRVPTPENEFEGLLRILRDAGDPLSEDRLQRKAQLIERLREGNIESICRVVRDLAYYGRKKKLSESDVMVMERAQKFLLDEWAISMHTTVVIAQQTLNRLLEEGWMVAQVSI